MLTIEQLRDTRWRMANLYHIIDDAGNDTVFHPNDVQQATVRDMWYRNVVLKSRKHGISTLLAVMSLDTALFAKNQDCQVISDTLVGAMRIFRRIIRHAYDHLPDEVKAISPIESATQTQLVFVNESIISVGTSARSTSPTFLHVSEFGRIACKWPEKAREILTGAIQAVASGGLQMVFVEATAMGKTGLFKDMVDRAKNIRDRGSSLSEIDMKLLFYPWYRKSSNRLDSGDQPISAAMEEYFAKLGVPLDIAQKRWYCTQYEILGPDMLVEHPSTEDEPFSVAIEGAYFSHQFRRIYAEKRIGVFPVRENVPVHTAWDIGMYDYMAIWFIQIIDSAPVAVDYYEFNDAGFDHYARVLRDRGYMYGTHYAPHDITVKELTGRTRLELAADYGIRFRLVPRIRAKMDAIELCRLLLNRMSFDESRCEAGIVHLEQYRKKWNALANGWSDDPADTGDQHGADALQTFAQGWDGNFKVEPTVKRTETSKWTGGRW